MRGIWVLQIGAYNKLMGGEESSDRDRVRANSGRLVDKN
jgi:hypothetical protein